MVSEIESESNPCLHRADFILTMGRKTEGDQRLADIFAKHMVGLVLKSFSHPLSVCVPLKSIIFLSHSYSSYQHQRLPSTSILF